jgi:hypothetical protein
MKVRNGMVRRVWLVESQLFAYDPNVTIAFLPQTVCLKWVARPVRDILP